MTVAVKLTSAQKRALRAAYEERVRYFSAKDCYVTLGWGQPQVRRNVIERLYDMCLVETVWRKSSNEGAVIPTELGLEALDSQ